MTRGGPLIGMCRIAEPPCVVCVLMVCVLMKPRPSGVQSRDCSGTSPAIWISRMSAPFRETSRIVWLVP